MMEDIVGTFVDMFVQAAQANSVLLAQFTGLFIGFLVIKRAFGWVEDGFEDRERDRKTGAKLLRELEREKRRAAGRRHQEWLDEESEKVRAGLFEGW
jgi:hypothetical protein